MCSKVTAIPLKTSTSYLSNNLTLFQPHSKPFDYQDVKYATISKNILNITQPKLDASQKRTAQIIFKPESFDNILDIKTQLNPFILQAQWCIFDSTCYLILCCYHMILVYDETGSSLLTAHRLPYTPGKSQISYAKGIAAYGKFLCIGMGNNEIIVFQMKYLLESEATFESFRTLQGHKGPISCLNADSEGILISGDDTGMVCTWKFTDFSKDDSVPKVVLVSSDNPCTGIVNSAKYFIASFGSGQLKLFNKNTLELDFEINAHARWINSIDICHQSQWIMAVSEDTCVSVWKIPNKENSAVECLCHQPIDSCVLTGGQFVDEDGTTIALSAYDLNEVLIYSLAVTQDEV